MAMFVTAEKLLKTDHSDINCIYDLTFANITIVIKHDASKLLSGFWK